MRLHSSLETYRIRTGLWATPPGSLDGYFRIDRKPLENLVVISSGEDAEKEIYWEHVSVSTRHRPPTWNEMCFVKDLFWDPEEPVMQLHPPRSEWVNNHPYTLHLFRPTNCKIPLPPSILVGYRQLGTIRPAKKES
jgi:hypothetical protein